MKALVQVDMETIEVQELPMPQIKDDEVLVKVRASGLCTNDVRDYLRENNYTLPRIGGHEFSGEIAETGSLVDPSHFSIGDHVVKFIIPACGECYFCKNGRENLCIEVNKSTTFYNESGISGFGGFAQYIAVKSRDLNRYPRDIPFKLSSFTEPLACAINSINQAEISFGNDVCVIGGGVMGLFHVMLAKLKGARVALSEPNEERRILAKSFGADLVFDPAESDPVFFIQEQTEGRGADLVFNTTALPQIAKQAIECTATGGKCFMFSSIHPNDLIAVDLGAVHSREKVITGTVSPTIQSFYQATQLISKKMIDPTPLIDRLFDYTEATKAFEHAMRPETLKTIITFD